MIKHIITGLMLNRRPSIMYNYLIPRLDIMSLSRYLGE